MNDELPTGHGIEDEPHLRPGGPRSSSTDGADGDEQRAAEILRDEDARGGRDGDAARDSVFEEAHSVRVAQPDSALIGRDVACPRCGWNRRGTLREEPCPACGHRPARAWAEWFQARRTEVPAALSWMIAGLTGLVTLPLAVIAGILPLEATVLPLLALVTPLFEEVLKVLALTMLVEIRPHYLRGEGQIRCVAILSALLYAGVEFVLNQALSLAHPEPAVLALRLLAGIVLHVTTTLLVAEGIVRVWLRCENEGRRPDLTPAARWFLAGVAVHVAYHLSMHWLGEPGLAF